MDLFNKDEIEELNIEIERLNVINDKYFNELTKLREENRELKKITKTYCYLEPKRRQITDEQIIYIKTLREKEGMSYKAIMKETGWSKATISRILNGKYDK